MNNGQSIRTVGFCLLFALAFALARSPLRADPDVRPGAGELTIEGRLSGTINSANGMFTIQACVVEMPGNNRTFLTKVVQKSVNMSAATTYYANGQPTQVVSFIDEEHIHFHICVVGIDHGHGKPLDARLVSLNIETDSQRLQFDRLASHPGQRETRKAPQIQSGEQSISYHGQQFDVFVVTAKLSTVAIRCGIAKDQVGATESLGAIAQRYGAIAAINGSFFDCYDTGPVKMPDMALISRGTLTRYSTIGTILGFTGDGQWRMETASSVIQMCGTNCRRNPGDDDDRFLFWSRVTEAVGCGPRLVVDGAPHLDPHAESIKSDEVLTPHTVRSAVGITSDGRILLVVAHRADLDDMAHIMVTLGARQAMNLDGGSSSGLWLRGKYLFSPGRDLSNALLIVAR